MGAAGPIPVAQSGTGIGYQRAGLIGEGEVDSPSGSGVETAGEGATHH